MTGKLLAKGLQFKSPMLPILPVREVVLYPHGVTALYLGRELSIKAVADAMCSDHRLVLLAQEDSTQDAVVPEQLHHIGVLAKVLQMFKLPDGTLKVLLEGEARVHCQSIDDSGDCLMAAFTQVVDQPGDALAMSVSVTMLMRLLDRYAKLKGSDEAKLQVEVFKGIADHSSLIDVVAAKLPFEPSARQMLLDEIHLQSRCELMLKFLGERIDRMEVEMKVAAKVKENIDQTNREHYLQQQMRVIQNELSGGDELSALEEKIKAAGLPEDVLEKAEEELAKLRQMSSHAAEATLIRNYLDWLIKLPWEARSKLKHDLKSAKAIFDRDHFGLEKVKLRLLEFLAVQSRVKHIRGPILCLVGPPGVGKTSLGESIAAATGREFIRIALGGVRDEAEIRGHRRTYIGAMPGKIIQKIAKVKVRNPVIMLDEIDKMGMDHRGDPASALLEVLDAEQNQHFDDHFLDVGFDLSEVMFIATANDLNIPAPLLDRMEVIRLAGYSEIEKGAIAKQYLIPKQKGSHGLEATEMRMTQKAIADMIRHYTKESGVRTLERQIAKVCRKVVMSGEMGTRTCNARVTASNLSDYLGVPKYHTQPRNNTPKVGQVTGLAWTSLGGELLVIEAALLPGKGTHQCTGSLGDVMQESVHAALSVVRTRMRSLGVSDDFYHAHDWHVHVPEGATPKDGPSAGIGMCTAMLSILLQKPVRQDVAMTGEITLSGEVLPIGGLKEKCLAAMREGITTVIIPEVNLKDLEEFASEIKSLTIKPVRRIEAVWTLALLDFPSTMTRTSRSVGQASEMPLPLVVDHDTAVAA